MRWHLNIQEFDLSVACIEGEHNNVADAMSMSRCLPTPEPDSQELLTPRHTVLEYLNGSTPMPEKLADIPEAWYRLIDSKELKQFIVPNNKVSSVYSYIQHDEPIQPAGGKSAMSQVQGGHVSIVSPLVTSLLRLAPQHLR